MNWASEILLTDMVSQQAMATQACHKPIASASASSHIAKDRFLQMISTII